jgi:ubiquinone/menaquinone biosynthesis C-methylase UbiE
MPTTLNFKIPWGKLSASVYNHILGDAVTQIYHSTIHDAIKKLDVKAPKILEVGCGAGYESELIAKEFPSCEIIGVDLAKEMIDEANTSREKLPGLKFQVTDALKLPFMDNEFDFVFTLASVKHWADLHKGLSEINRVLKPNGKALVLEIDKNCSKDAAERWVQMLNLSFLGSRAVLSYFFRKVAVTQSLKMETLSSSMATANFKDLTATQDREYPFMYVIANKA